MSAQLEDGYTRIANEILERVYQTKFNGTQFSILLFVWRNTYGFQRKSKDMSLNYIAAGIDTHKDQVKRELDRLIEWKVIVVYEEASFNKTRVIGFNKDCDEWKVQSPEKSIQSAKTSTVNESIGEQSAKKSTPTVDVLAHQINKDFKEIKKTYIAHFDEVWSIYPKKVGKEKARDHWTKKIVPLLEKGQITVGDILKGTRAYIHYCEKSERYLKDGSAYVNQQTWNDFLDGSPSVEPKTQFKASNRAQTQLELVKTTVEDDEYYAKLHAQQVAANKQRVATI